jgi:hypothetical protein
MGAPLEHDASQAPGCKSAGIDIDAVGQNLRLFNRSMSVHDDSSKIPRAREKLTANPKEITGFLAVQRNSWTYPRVTEKVLP